MSDQASGVATNLALGFLFGFLPVVGVLFGLTLESRHVTIASASAIFSLDTIFSGAWKGEAITGSAVFDAVGPVVGALVIIGLANLIVSFALAYTIAARACATKSTWSRLLLSSVLSRLLRRPFEFLLPYTAATTTPVDIGVES